MAKTKNITRKNRKQRGGDITNGQGPSYEEFMKGIGKSIEEDNTKEQKNLIKLQEDASNDDEYYRNVKKQAEEEARKEAASEQAASTDGNSFLSNLTNWFRSNPATGGNKKQPNPAFGGYLKGGKKHVRNTKKNTKKRTGGNKCNCGCRNCRCSRKDCNCKCADKRFNCTCTSRTCGCKRTLKRRKH